MKCIIMGAGKVGFGIAAALVKGDHEVVVIDIDRERLEIVSQSLDVMTIEGNGAHWEIQQKAGVENADLLVAVTEADEINMVACFLAKSVGVGGTIARVREPGYSAFNIYHKAMGIDLIINPEKVAAEEIYTLARFPEARSVKFFADGQVQMLELKLEANSSLVGKTLKEIRFPIPCVVVGITRGEDIFVPNGDNMLYADDILTLFFAVKDVNDVENFVGTKHVEVNNIMIFGGDLITYYLAKMFEADALRHNVKIVESDVSLCDELAESLNHTLIIHGIGTNMQLLEDENVGDMDMCLALTDDDKENVLVSILAKQMGGRKTVAQLRRSDYIPMMEKIGIDRAISPRSLTVEAILRFISHGHLKNISILKDERLKVGEISIPANAKVDGHKLKDLRFFPKSAIIGVIFRDGNIIIPSGNDELREGDSVVVLGVNNSLEHAQDYLVRV